MTPREYTEDDTFNALRRIPKSQVDLKLKKYATWVEQFREDHYKSKSYNEGLVLPNIIRRWLGLTMRSPWIYYMDHYFVDSVNAQLDGTGWNFDAYVDAVDKPILEKRALVRSIKIKRRIYSISSITLILALGVATGLMLGKSISISFLLGLSLTNFAIITYRSVADRRWPYPEYHWRYE